MTSVVLADPVSVWAAETLPDVMVTAEVVTLFPCCPGDTWTDERKSKGVELIKKGISITDMLIITTTTLLLLIQLKY